MPIKIKPLAYVLNLFYHSFILYYILYYIIYSTLTISKKIKDLSYCIKSTHCITWWYIRLDIKKSNIALHDKMFFIHFEILTMAISQKKIYRIKRAEVSSVKSIALRTLRHCWHLVHDLT